MVDVADSKSADGDIVWVRVPPPAPRQNKAARSCGGTSTATSTGDLVFPFPSQTHSVGLCDGIGPDLDCPGAPRRSSLRTARKRQLQSSCLFLICAPRLLLFCRDPLTLGSRLIVELVRVWIAPAHQKGTVPSGTVPFCMKMRGANPRALGKTPRPWNINTS